jgi:hypothetical protein
MEAAYSTQVHTVTIQKTIFIVTAVSTSDLALKETGLQGVNYWNQLMRKLA